MAISLKLRRGTTAQNDSFVGSEAELSYDTQTKGLRIHDGTKIGGYIVDTIVEFQEPTAANNYTWARKYASGWVEQGGIATIPSRTNDGSSSVAVVFPIRMRDTNYSGQISFQNGGAYFANCQLTFSSRTNADANLEFYFNSTGTTDAFLVGWEVKGMAA